MVQQDKRLIPAPKGRRDYLGDISPMTEWRWVQAGILPPPVKINKRNFYYEADLLAVPQRAAEIEARKEAAKAEQAA